MTVREKKLLKAFVVVFALSLTIVNYNQRVEVVLKNRLRQHTERLTELQRDRKDIVDQLEGHFANKVTTIVDLYDYIRKHYSFDDESSLGGKLRDLAISNSLDLLGLESIQNQTDNLKSELFVVEGWVINVQGTMDQLSRFSSSILSMGGITIDVLRYNTIQGRGGRLFLSVYTIHPIFTTENELVEKIIDNKIISDYLVSSFKSRTSDPQRTLSVDQDSQSIHSQANIERIFNVLYGSAELVEDKSEHTRLPEVPLLTVSEPVVSIPVATWLTYLGRVLQKDGTTLWYFKHTEKDITIVIGSSFAESSIGRWKLVSEEEETLIFEDNQHKRWEVSIP